MRKVILRCAVLGAAAMSLSGCYDKEPDTALVGEADYSPNYSYVNVASNDGRTKRVLAPDACLTGDTSAPVDAGPPRLPPGCANNFNLQRMAERKRDLTHGRPLGPAPGEPAARAAQRYLDGNQPPPLGGAVRSNEIDATQTAAPEPGR
jgi:type IV pilus biogenesis protein CpaD/CtpE